jgi:S-adenosylmethionine hydrolase
MTIALVTDFGTRDYYVGAMKGIMLSIDPQANVVDITHEIAPQDIVEAAFVLRACYRDFPKGTIFLCVVDPGVGSNRRAIIVETADHRFVGPDNGVFSFAARSADAIYSIENDAYFRRPVSSTFHGRDIFAPAAAHLSKGVSPAEFGPQIDDPILLPDAVPYQIEPNTVDGSVIHIDRFGNLVTNLDGAIADRPFKIEIGNKQITRLLRSYAEAETDGPFAIVGSAGLIEISVKNGSAAERLRVTRGTLVTLRFI